MDIKITKKQKTGLVIFLLLILLIISVVYFKNKSNIPKDEIKSNKVLVKETKELENSKEKLKESNSVKEIKAYICGYVLNPGVYLLREGDRLEDLIKASGGAKEDADIEGINLAYEIKDQDYFRIGSKDEAKLTMNNENPNVGLISSKTTISNSQSGNNESQSQEEGKININTATKEELMKLPRIGDSMSQRIIDYREKEGNFKLVDDIKEVSGIGDKMFENIKDQITIE